MKQVVQNLRETINSKNSVFLFTGNKESTLLMSIMKDMNVNIVFIDTGCHFNEIIKYVESFANKIETIHNTKASADPMIDMDKCCGQRKTVVVNKYLEDMNAQYLIVPFRDEEKDNGIEYSYLKGIDNIEILRPLSDMSEREVWMKIKEKKLPFSKIYNKGYRFVDCKCCTTRHSIKKQTEDVNDEELDKETEEKLKALGYM